MFNNVESHVGSTGHTGLCGVANMDVEKGHEGPLPMPGTCGDGLTDEAQEAWARAALGGMFNEHAHFLEEFAFGFRFLDLGAFPSGFSEALLADPRCTRGYGVCTPSAPCTIRDRRYYVERASLLPPADPRWAVRAGPVELALCTANVGDYVGPDRTVLYWALMLQEWHIALHRLEPCGVVIARFLNPVEQKGHIQYYGCSR